MEQRVQTICLAVIAAVAVAGALHWLRSVMVPFVLAVFIAEALSPLIALQVSRLRMPRTLALLSTLMLGGLMLVLVGSLVSASVGQLAANADLYASQLAKLLNRVTEWLPEDLGDFAPEARVRELLAGPVGSVGRLLMGTTNAIVDLLSRSVVVVLFVAFLLIGGGEPTTTGVWGEIRRSVRRFLLTKAAISAATGILVGSTLALLGVDLALVFGLFAFLLNFIPSIGSILATLLPLPVVMVNPEISPGTALAAIAIPGAFQTLIGNVLEPRIMGSSLDLHPVTILLALMIWGVVWGIVGMLLATPITAVMKILFDRFEGTRVLADLMAGRTERLTLHLAGAPPG